MSKADKHPLIAPAVGIDPLGNFCRLGRDEVFNGEGVDVDGVIAPERGVVFIIPDIPQCLFDNLAQMLEGDVTGNLTA